jgi:hypothetical protein
VDEFRVFEVSTFLAWIIRLGLNCLLETNTLAYFKKDSIVMEKKIPKSAPGVNVIKIS